MEESVTISQKELDEAQIEETPYKQKSGRIIEQTEGSGVFKGLFIPTSTHTGSKVACTTKHGDV